MCNNRECANYLKNNPAYTRLMKELWKKWESYGKVTGKITLQNTSEQERRAIGGIVGKTFTDEIIKITFQEFAQGLQKTRFAPIDMQVVLEEFFGRSLCTNQEQKLQKQQARDKFFGRLLIYFEVQITLESVVFPWIEEVKNSKKFGYQIIMKEFAREPKDAEMLVQNVGNALSRLEKLDGEERLLAVFSAEISGNPHYFDRGKTATQLLTHAICFWKNMDAPATAYEWRKCMQEVGLASDNIASMIHALGLRLETAEGMHPAYEIFCDRKEPYVITAENLRGVTGAKAYQNRVYVVENEMVFLYLAEHTKERNVTLLCTSGQLRVAAFQILDYLAESGAMIYYSGDLDPEGMDIADRLWQRYGNTVRLWRMDEADYSLSISGELLTDRQLAKLARLKNEVLRRTAEAVRKEKKAGYQEHLLEALVQDII